MNDHETDDEAIENAADASRLAGEAQATSRRIITEHAHDPRCQGPMTRADIDSNIRAHGVHLTGVLGSPPFVYTIGLSPTMGYELIVLGCEYRAAAAMLNKIADGILHLERELELDALDSRWFGLPVMFKWAADTPALHERYVCAADWYYGQEVGVVQLVLPDPNKRFQWEAEFDPRWTQPMLWRSS